MEFYCYELQRSIQAKNRPIVIITSNNEKELPDAFLRRCFFHYISFPDRNTLEKIVEIHYPDLENELIQEAMIQFEQLRNRQGLKKKPSTSELLDWIKLLMVNGINAEGLRQEAQQNKVPLIGAVIKNEQDLALIEQKYR